MERYTEYHGGKAVIKEKSKLTDALAELARLEDLKKHGKMTG